MPKSYSFLIICAADFIKSTDPTDVPPNLRTKIDIIIYYFVMTFVNIFLYVVMARINVNSYI